MPKKQSKKGNEGSEQVSTSSSGEGSKRENSEEQFYDFMTILQKYPDFMYVSDPDTYEVLFVNDNLRNIIKDFKPGRKCYELFHGASGPCDFCTNDIIQKTGMPHVWDYYNDYLRRHFLNTDQIITWHDGRKVRFETAIDITDQKKIEALLQASEKKYRSFIEQSSYGFFILNLELEVTYLNQVAKNILGVESNQNAQFSIASFLSQEDLKRARANLEMISRGMNVERPGIYTIKRKDGNKRTVEIQIFPVWREETLVEYHGTMLDITERINSERIIREKTELLDSVINNSSDGIFVVDEDVKYVLINPASGRILGHDPKEWIGKKAGTHKHPEDGNQSEDAFLKAMGGEPSSCEVRVKAKDGTFHLLEIRYNQMILNDNYHVLGMVTDITERKKAELAIIESEKRIKTLGDNLPEGAVYILEHLPNGKKRFQYVSQGMVQLFGIEIEKLLEDAMPIYDMILPDDIDSAIADEQRAAETGDIYSYESRFRLADGNIKWIQWRSRPHTQSDGTIIWDGVCFDITNRKMSESAIKTSEEKFRSLFENSPEAIVILGKEGQIIECNNATAGLMEKKIEEIIGKRFDELGILDTAQLDIYRKIFMAMAEGKELNKSEVELVMKDGRSKWIEVIPSMIARAGEFYGIQMIARDITDRKFADIEMRKKLLKFDIESGNVYLAKEPSATHSIEAFRELLMIGNEGLLISRKSRKDFQSQIDYMFNHVKVSETEQENHVKPDYKSIHQLVSNLPRGHVIHIDCIEYLISRIGANKTIIFVQYLKDLAMAKGHVVLMSIDPNAIAEKELRIIEKESVEILPSQSLAKLSEKFIEILKYIDDMNREGAMPSYSDLCEHFDISKPTARSRIRQLNEMGTVKEVQRGRMKILEITDKGKNYLVV